MRSVFEGGEGCIRAGRSDRSIDSVGEWRPLDVWLEDREIGGVLSCWVAMMVSTSVMSGLLCCDLVIFSFEQQAGSFSFGQISIGEQML